MSVEDRLREWGAAERAAALPTTVPVERFRHARPTRALTTAAAVLVVLALAVAVAMTRQDQRDAPGEASARTTTPHTVGPVPAPAGYRNVTFHGLTVAVPSSWPTNAERCGTPLQNTVIVADGPTLSCLIARPTGVTDVQFSNNPTVGDDGPATTINGVTGVRTETIRKGLHVVSFIVTDLAARVTVSSASTAQINRILSTVQESPFDANGCPARMPDLRIDHSYAGGAKQELVPSHPTSLVACGYLFFYLEQSKRVDPSHSRTILNALPSGLSTSNANASAGFCWNHADSVHGDEDDAATTVLRFGYADGSTVVLRARLGLCGLVGVTNGARTGQRTQALVDLITGIGVSGGAYKQTVRPAK